MWVFFHMEVAFFILMCTLVVEAGTPQPRLSREDITNPGVVGVAAYSPGDSNAPLMVRGMPSHQKRRRVSVGQQENIRRLPNVVVASDELPPESFETPDRDATSQSFTGGLKRVAVCVRFGGIVNRSVCSL